MFHETRLVKTGQIISRPWAWANRFRIEVPTLLVSIAECRRPCVCDGFEVCLHHHSDGCKSPVWPVMSAASLEEARVYAARLRAFSRVYNPDDFNYDAPHVDGSNVLLKDWIAAQGFVQRNRVVWGKL